MSSSYANNAELYGSEEGFCDNCGEEVSEDFVLINAYGDKLCEDCWDEYINSEEGGVEYFISICNDPSDIDFYDADALGSFATSWMKHKNELNLTPAQIADIEVKARALKILD